MALLTRKEFAAMCRTTTAIVTTNISRGKVIEFDKKIDTENVINQEFFDKYLKKAQAEKDKLPSPEEIDQMYKETVETLEQKAKAEVTTKHKKAKRDENNAKWLEAHEWDIRKKKADALLQERKAEQAQLQLEKMAGKLIPVDLVFEIIKVHNTDIFATFQNDAENIASIYCDILAAGDRKKLSEITEKLNYKLDDAVKRAKDVAMASINNAVEEYSQTRNRGERK